MGRRPSQHDLAYPGGEENMSLWRKTRTRVENIVAWVLAIGVIGLLIAGAFYALEVFG